jgi:hypothetical protein
MERKQSPKKRTKRWFLPEDTVMFLSTLEEACKPYAVDKVHLDFSITRQSLAQLQRKFVEIFKFLKEAYEDKVFHYFDCNLMPWEVFVQSPPSSSGSHMCIVHLLRASSNAILSSSSV